MSSGTGSGRLRAPYSPSGCSEGSAESGFRCQDCLMVCKSAGGLTKHRKAKHPYIPRMLGMGDMDEAAPDDPALSSPAPRPTHSSPSSATSWQLNNLPCTPQPHIGASAQTHDDAFSSPFYAHNCNSDNIFYDGFYDYMDIESKHPGSAEPLSEADKVSRVDNSSDGDVEWADDELEDSDGSEDSDVDDGELRVYGDGTRDYQEQDYQEPELVHNTDTAGLEHLAEQTGSFHTGLHREFHPLLNGVPCDAHGNALEPNPPLPALPNPSPPGWTPYDDRFSFELAEFLYTKEQMSEGHINTLLDMWMRKLAQFGEAGSFHNADEMYSIIDNTPLGDVKWETFSVRYNGKLPVKDVPEWMEKRYEVWYRDPHTIAQQMLANKDYMNQIDYCAVHETLDGKPKLKDFMSGDWAWRQSNKIAKDQNTHGSMFVPIILGSDKTTVSVGTGDNEFYPLYMALGNHHNAVRRAHRGAVALIGFLAIPKTDKAHKDTLAFRKFRRQIFHSSLARILESLKPGMTLPEVTLCADGHFRRALYGIGPYIADYPEQALLACIVQGWCPKCTGRNTDLDGDHSPSILRSCEHTESLIELLDLGTLWSDYGIVGDLVPFTNNFPRADIHELIAPDILHQLIKGTFKDHLVEWVGEYLMLKHGKAQADKILSDIDRRIAVVPPFTGLRRFPQGRGFKQWTGDDSKALMKHSLKHWPRSIWEFGAPNGLCSSITESKHIKAVKEPYRRSSRYEALAQMLLTNQRLDKLAASRVDFQSRGMLEPLPKPKQRKERVDGLGAPEESASIPMDKDDGAITGLKQPDSIKLATKYRRCHSRYPTELLQEVDRPTFHTLVRQFLRNHLVEVNDLIYHEEDKHSLPEFHSPIYIHYSAKAIYYAPSDPSGVGGMRREYIRANPKWRKGDPRFDCVLVKRPVLEGPSVAGKFQVARIFLLFSFKFSGVTLQCALVQWFDWIAGVPDEDTGMWMVERCRYGPHSQPISVIPLHLISRAVHLVPVYGDQPVPKDLSASSSLDSYDYFFVNKYADHHTYELFGSD
ncbi:hypothetical protein NEOLEDRAFT_1184396 [Neolentinus lepideus HHB14362 ss-1]|uniref:C2H2-type domain-containing protein n=1 Tax=Neolentinus lepideus HHB14362 ss-1 TaxID=1314782 RepID=A0A165MG70_9AGAM|nr:hypothetical protein NEOLEDRAFT_1184396 [Neolentinus lepideus HHB14362 ss-1]